jgi:hypothetical protein
MALAMSGRKREENTNYRQFTLATETASLVAAKAVVYRCDFDPARHEAVRQFPHGSPYNSRG